MKKPTRSHARKVPPIPFTASEPDTHADDSRQVALTVHSTEDALFIIKSIGAILSGYTTSHTGTEGIQGIGCALENLAEAGEESLVREQQMARVTAERRQG